jgi:[ribosomal protein S5]-alanine N-acetyltransferase
MSTVSCEWVQTARLLCERLRLEHEAEISHLLRDPRVARTLTADGLPPSEREVCDGLLAKISHWERYGFGLWTVRDRASGEMVGRGGLQHTVVEGSREFEAGWAIVPERWGQGLATELAGAAVEVASEPLRLHEIVAFTLPHNIASRRVMEKAGFAYKRDVIIVGLPHVLYRRPLRP